MPIDSLTAGPPAVASSRKASATAAGAPPGFSAALDTAAKTWTARAEGQTETPQGGNERPAAKDSPTALSPSAHAPGEATPAHEPEAVATSEQGAKADKPAKADEPAKADKPGKADAAEAASSAATADASVLVAVPAVPVVPATPLPAVLAAAQAALAAQPDPALQTALPAEAAVVAQVATQVQAAATAVAAGAPVDPAAPGIAELLASVESGETKVADLPEAVQALVAKATAQLAAGPVPAGAATPNPASPQPAAAGAGATPAPVVPATAPAVAPTDTAAVAQASTEPVAAAAVAAAVAPTSNADGAAPAPAPLSPLAAAIQAAAQAQSGASTEGEASPGQGQPGMPQPAQVAAAAASPQAAAAQASGQEPVPVAPVEPSSIAIAPASAPAVSTVAAPAVPTVSAGSPSQQAAAIEALVHLSRTRGHSSARIALAPEQLGGIQVTLIFGADGVTARLIAERPEAAAALQRAGQDLKESLQQQGVDLARLETCFAGDHGNGRGERQAAGADTGRFGSSPGRHDRGAGDSADQTLHIAIGDQPAPEPLIPGRLVDLRA